MNRIKRQVPRENKEWMESSEDPHMFNFTRSVPLNLRRDLDLTDTGDRLAFIIESLQPYIDVSTLPAVDDRDTVRDIDATLANLASMSDSDMLFALGRMLCSTSNAFELKCVLLSCAYETLSAKRRSRSVPVALEASPQQRSPALPQQQHHHSNTSLANNRRCLLL